MTIANPANPQIISSSTIAGTIQDIAVAGNLALVGASGNTNGGFYVIDFSVPTNPVQVGHLALNPLAPEATSVAVQGSLAFVTNADGFGGRPTLTVIDYGNPSTPEAVASIPILDGGYGTRSALVGEILYLHTWDGLLSIDVSDPFAPRSLGQTHDADAYDVAANGEIACVSLREGGLVIYPAQCGSGAVSVSELQLSSQTALGAVYPNPFHQGATIHLAVANACQARLTVHDVAGRLVRHLAHRRFGEGSHAVVWNGQDESALPVSPGVYFVRLETPDHQETRRVVRLR
jgi:hypothetical protein